MAPTHTYHLPAGKPRGAAGLQCPPAFGTETFLEKTSKKTEGRWYFFPADWAVWGHSMQHFIRCTVPRSCKQQQLSGWPPTPAAQHELCASRPGKHRKKRETHRLPAQSLCDVPELQQPAQHQPLSCLLSQQHGHGRSMHCCPCEALGAVFYPCLLAGLGMQILISQALLDFLHKPLFAEVDKADNHFS